MGGIIFTRKTTARAARLFNDLRDAGYAVSVHYTSADKREGRLITNAPEWVVLTLSKN